MVGYLQQRSIEHYGILFTTDVTDMEEPMLEDDWFDAGEEVV